MDYKEKYEMALEGIQEILGSGEDSIKMSRLQLRLQGIFPELAESKDERIRKEIIAFIKKRERSGCDYDYNLWIDWLEKQDNKPQGKSALEAIKEEKVDNAIKVVVEPKFKIGDFVVDNCGYVWKIEEILNQLYLLEGVEGGESRPAIGWVNKTFHLWTIADAKDGDMLVASDGSIFLFAGVVDCACKYYFALTTCNDAKINKEVDSGYWETSRAVHPATKEQREQLEKAMADAGYTFDFEKKELKEIESKFKVGDVIEFTGRGHNRYTIKEVCGLSHYINTMGNRMEMSYTDANFEVIKEIEIPLGAKDSELQEAIYYIPKGFHAEIKGDSVFIKKGEKPTAWSEDDEEEFQIAIDTLVEAGQRDSAHWLKSFKDRVQPKVELTQVDKIILEAAIAFVEHNNHFNCWRGVDKHTVLSALHSLRPQKQWKPSEEQMKALAWALSLAKNCGEECAFDLRTLHEQLEKL